MPFLRCGRFVLDLSRPLVMGVLNVTPDSFSDGGRFLAVEQAITQAERMIEEGADIIDIGGESTRPKGAYQGVVEVSVEEELNRVMPVLACLHDKGVPVSLDTRRTDVMREVIQSGWVDMINDVSALKEEGALACVAASDVAVCLMHKECRVRDEHNKPVYTDVVKEVGTYLADRVSECLKAGIQQDRLLVDPGYGFAKTLEHNLQLIHSLKEIEHYTQTPVLVGLSRKLSLMRMTGEPVPDERVGATVAANYEALIRGARVIRVHDVKPNVQAVRVWSSIHA